MTPTGCGTGRGCFFTRPSINDVLDETDSLLEENAEDFVKSYVQRTGTPSS